MFSSLLEIGGGIKFNFREEKHKSNESTYGIGSITDGTNKMEICLITLNGLPPGLVKGQYIYMKGTIQFRTYLLIMLESGADVTASVDIDPKTVDEMLNITSRHIR